MNAAIQRKAKASSSDGPEPSLLSGIAPPPSAPVAPSPAGAAKLHAPPTQQHQHRGAQDGQQQRHPNGQQHHSFQHQHQFRQQSFPNQQQHHQSYPPGSTAEGPAQPPHSAGFPTPPTGGGQLPYFPPPLSSHPGSVAMSAAQLPPPLTEVQRKALRHLDLLSEMVSGKIAEQLERNKVNAKDSLGGGLGDYKRKREALQQQQETANVDLFGSFVKNNDENRQDFFDRDPATGAILAAPLPARVPIFPEDFPPNGPKEWPLSWWGIQEPTPGLMRLHERASWEEGFPVKKRGKPVPSRTWKDSRGAAGGGGGSKGSQMDPMDRGTGPREEHRNDARDLRRDRGDMSSRREHGSGQQAGMSRDKNHPRDKRNDRYGRTNHGTKDGDSKGDHMAVERKEPFKNIDDRKRDRSSDLGIEEGREHFGGKRTERLENSTGRHLAEHGSQKRGRDDWKHHSDSRRRSGESEIDPRERSRSERDRGDRDRDEKDGGDKARGERHRSERHPSERHRTDTDPSEEVRNRTEKAHDEKEHARVRADIGYAERGHAERHGEGDVRNNESFDGSRRSESREDAGVAATKTTGLEGALPSERNEKRRERSRSTSRRSTGDSHRSHHRRSSDGHRSRERGHRSERGHRRHDDEQSHRSHRSDKRRHRDKDHRHSSKERSHRDQNHGEQTAMSAGDEGGGRRARDHDYDHGKVRDRGHGEQATGSGGGEGGDRRAGDFERRSHHDRGHGEREVGSGGGEGGDRRAVDRDRRHRRSDDRRDRTRDDRSRDRAASGGRRSREGGERRSHHGEAGGDRKSSHHSQGRGDGGHRRPPTDGGGQRERGSWQRRREGDRFEG